VPDLEKEEKSGVILVVDDDRATRMFHQAILATKYTVESVESGDAALKVFDQLNPDLIVLDVEMPGLNGY